MEPNWIPEKLVTHPEINTCQWLYVNEKPFTEPFFSDSILKCKQLPENSFGQKRCSSLDEMAQWSAAIESVATTAIIFHVSRCGSTLVSQLLSLDDSNIVLSEVPFLDEMLRLPYKKHSGTDAKKAGSYFKAALRFYGQKRNGKETRLFIKADSWHLMFYQQLRQMYPSIPFIILYRSPDEVIRSQNNHRGMQSVPGVIEAGVFGFTEADISFDLDLYMSRVLGKYFTSILNIADTDPNAYLVNYKEGMASIMKQVMALTGISTSEAYNQAMEERSRFHSKSAGESFLPEPLIGKSPAWLDSCFSAYHKIEQLRQSRQ